MLGWIAPIVLPSLSGAVADQFFPPSLLHSKCTCHLLGSACDSVLDAGDDGAVGELHGLVLDRTEDAVGQTPRLAPRAPAVAARAQHPPPLLRRRTHLVEQHQRSTARLEEDGIPRRIPRAVRLHAVGDFDARRPPILLAPRHPDPDVRRPLARPPEPRRHELVLRRLDDRRRMHRGIRPGLVDELLEHDRRIVDAHGESRERARRAAERKKASSECVIE